ncbi:hypothetical protein SAMN06265337_0622 [Hymenobacter gelipurpurascens]|uniref:Uncharacterized protein n=2 Tax=Hymenobacter gelipurpurascens TaxID=89968 RepID=A0A212T812_9BACT|nr:hypothetical protein SAMN06265337_0622 [Hymenobacter gelipurpurascens]
MRDMPYEFEVLAICKSSDARRIYEWEQSILEPFAHNTLQA